MTVQDAENGIAILTSLRGAGVGSMHYRMLCEQFHGWAMTHAEDLVELAASEAGMARPVFPPQQMATMPDTDIRGTAPARRAQA